MEADAEDLGQRTGQRRLANTGDVFKEQMTASQDGRETEAHRLGIAAHDLQDSTLDIEKDLVGSDADVGHEVLWGG
jgi:hypothetical protein